MRNVAILYNPASGQNYRGGNGIAEAVEILRGSGLQVDLIATEAAGSAGRQAKEAIAAGHDTVLACGGDGTINEVLQGMIRQSEGENGQSEPQATLGILPMGTANALATDLCLPTRDPVRAAQKLLTYKPRTLAAIRTESMMGGRPQVRYSTVMSGVGPDAHLVYELGLAAKQKWGLASYLVYAAYLFVTDKLPPFSVEITRPDGTKLTKQVAQVMAIRIKNFGAPLRNLAPGAALEKDAMRLVLFYPKHVRWNMWVYLHSGLLNHRIALPGIELMDAQSVICRPDNSKPKQDRIYAQADGEILGGMPVTFTMVPRAFRMLLPPERAAD